MGIPTSLTCVLCGSAYEESPDLYCCHNCGELGTLRVEYDYDVARSSLSRQSLAARPFVDIWRYLPLLPLRAREVSMPLRVGATPLYPAPELRKSLGLESLWVKDDTCNP